MDVGATGCKYVDVYGFMPPSASLKEMRGVDSAVYLHLTNSNIRTLDGVAELGPIKRLEMTYCLKLEDSSGLLGLQPTLEWLSLDQCRKVRVHQILRHFPSLKVLCLNQCAPLDDLSFLKQLPQLLDFRFVNTNVLNGDMTPIIEHPSLVSVGFLNKRHFSHTEAELDAYFRGKDEKLLLWAHMGKYRTFKYKTMQA